MFTIYVFLYVTKWALGLFIRDLASETVYWSINKVFKFLYDGFVLMWNMEERMETFTFVNPFFFKVI